MVTSFSILCHFFFICYDPRLIRFPVPAECEGYIAPPPPPFTSAETDKAYISVKCTNLITLNRIPRKFNTLHYSDQNHINDFKEDSFNGMSVASLVFQEIIFGFNMAEHVKGNVFNGIQDLKAISFVAVNLEKRWAHYKAFHALTQLEYIYMKKVSIKGIPKEFDHVSFQNVKIAEFDTLMARELSMNVPEENIKVPTGVFDKWKNLRMLTITSCQLESFDWLAGEFFNLLHLDISSNYLTSIADNLITPDRFPKLKYLNLNGNWIKEISENVLPSSMWKQFSEVYMNRLCCNYKLEWMIPILEKQEVPSSFYLLCYPQEMLIQTIQIDHFRSKTDCRL